MQKTDLFALIALAACSCQSVVVEPDPQAAEGPVEWSFGGDGSTNGDGPKSRPADVVITADGTTLIAATPSQQGCGLERISADGTYLGLTKYESALGNQMSEAKAVALGPNGEIVLLCIAIRPNIYANAWVGWLTPEGKLMAEAELPSVYANDLVVTDDPDEVILVGVNEETFFGTYEHVSKSGPTGVALALDNEPGGEMVARAVERHPDGWNVVIHGIVTDGENPTYGDEILRVDGLTPTVLGVACGHHLAIAPDGTIYTGTYELTRPTRVCRHTESGGSWTVQDWSVSIEGATSVGIMDIDIDPFGGVVVTGAERSERPIHPRIFAIAYGSSGETIWTDTFAGPEPREVDWDMAIGASADRVVYAGAYTGSSATVVRSLAP